MNTQNNLEGSSVMSETHSVTQLLQQLQEGDSLVAHQIWDRFIDRLVVAARNHLRNLPRRAVDEEDVAVTAFNAFLCGVQDGRFKKLDSREDLWMVLAMLIERKAIAVLRQELAIKRGGGQVRGESVFQNMLGDPSGETRLQDLPDPDPDVVEDMTVEVRERLAQLGEAQLQKIAILKLEGYTNPEIHQKLGISLRSVERKLQLIRAKWECDIDE